MQIIFEIDDSALEAVQHMLWCRQETDQLAGPDLMLAFLLYGVAGTQRQLKPITKELLTSVQDAVDQKKVRVPPVRKHS